MHSKNSVQPPLLYSTKEIRQAIEELRAMNLSSADFAVVKGKVEILLSCGFMTAEVPEGKVIFRGRVWSGVEPIFKTKAEISYPPKPGTKLSFNRASSNQLRVFYGAIGTSDLPDAEVIAHTEVSDVLMDHYPQEKFEYIVLGQWIVKRPILAATFGLHSSIASNNSQAKDMLKFHDSACKDLSERGKLIGEVAKFLSAEFSKIVDAGQNHDYKISAAVGDLLFGRQFGAVLFPTVKGDGKAFNAAILDVAVDNCMELRVAGVSRSEKIGKQVIVDWVLECPEVVNDKIKWQEPTQGAWYGYDRRQLKRKLGITERNGQ